MYKNKIHKTILKNPKSPMSQKIPKVPCHNNARSHFTPSHPLPERGDTHRRNLSETVPSLPLGQPGSFCVRTKISVKIRVVFFLQQVECNAHILLSNIFLFLSSPLFYFPCSNVEMVALKNQQTTRRTKPPPQRSLQSTKRRRNNPSRTVQQSIRGNPEIRTHS